MRWFFHGFGGVVVVAMMVSCSREDPPRQVADPSADCRHSRDCNSPMVCVNNTCTTPAIQVPEKPSTASRSPIPPPKAVNRPILVGGCLGSCDRAKDSVHHFLKSVLSKDRDLPRIRSFVETSILQHNRIKLGEAWADLYRLRKLTERAESIDQWLAQWLEWADQIVDPLDRQVERAIINVVFQDQSRYVIEYHRPDINDDLMRRPIGTVWRIELRKRGLEWLVARINDRPSSARSAP